MFWAFYIIQTTGRRPKHPQRSKSKCFMRTQIRWVIWRSSKVSDSHLCQMRIARHIATSASLVAKVDMSTAMPRWPRAHTHTHTYPLTRNQYINNSPGIFPVFAWVRIQAQHVFAPTWILSRIWLKCRKWSFKTIFLYSRNCKYRPRIYSRKN